MMASVKTENREGDIFLEKILRKPTVPCLRNQFLFSYIYVGVVYGKRVSCENKDFFAASAELGRRQNSEFPHKKSRLSSGSLNITLDRNV